MLYLVINNLRTAWHGLLNVRKVDPKGHAVVVEGGCIDILVTLSQEVFRFTLINNVVRKVFF